MVEKHQFERRIDWPEEETGRRQLSGTKGLLGPIDFMWVRTWPEQTLTSVIYGVHMLGLVSLRCSPKPRKPQWGWTGGGSLGDFLHHDRYFEALWSLFWIGIRHNSAFSASLNNFKIEQRFLLELSVYVATTFNGILFLDLEGTTGGEGGGDGCL